MEPKKLNPAASSTHVLYQSNVRPRLTACNRSSLRSGTRISKSRPNLGLVLEIAYAILISAFKEATASLAPPVASLEETIYAQNPDRKRSIIEVLSNAIDASGSSAVPIQVVNQAGMYCVEDAGIGMDLRTLHRTFLYFAHFFLHMLIAIMELKLLS